MCGIAGSIAPAGTAAVGNVRASATAAGAALAHRGPDSADVWVDDRQEVALAHRRLAIVDLSENGCQPMHSPSGRYVCVFNGEIYNFKALRALLHAVGFEFRGHSDTEVLLAGFEAWGVERTVQQCIGMFAIGVWDRKDRLLRLVRDRLGEKPLYYGWVGGAFCFASELKALRCCAGWHGEIDADALAAYFTYNYVPGPRSIYRDISKLPPGTVLTLDPRSSGAHPTIAPYWSLREVLDAGTRAPFRGSDADAVNQLDELLRGSVAQQMVADVPLGAFLSGGIDSSTIVAMMQAQSTVPIRTFTIGFREEGFNEAEYAAAVARHIGTQHTALYVSPAEAMDVIPDLPRIYDEPFADSSQIPTYLVSRLARRSVKVSLSGDGGDELFAGYNRYLRGPELWRRLSRVPRGSRRRIAASLLAIPPGVWNGVGRALPGRWGSSRIAERIRKVAAVLQGEGRREVHQSLVTVWPDAHEFVRGAAGPVAFAAGGEDVADLADMATGMMYVDTLSYLPDDILAKVDRAAMAVGLETRVPFLDHRVVEFAWRLPAHLRMRNGKGKWVLRQVLDRYVPRTLIERPKMGFGVPVGTWLRGPLRDWAEALLNERALEASGLLNSSPIRRAWREHLNGTRDGQFELWGALMFQGWLHHTMDSTNQSIPSPELM